MLSEQRPLKVFLCYSSLDSSRVGPIYDRLSKETVIELWMSEKTLLGGQDWELEIEKAVEQADRVIVFLSKESVTKDGYFWKELRKILDQAQEKIEGRIFVITVRLNECEVPRGLKRWQWINYFPSEERNKAYSILVKSLSSEAAIQVQDLHDDIEWINPKWWIREIRAGLKGPRAVVSLGLAAVSLMCNICLAPAFCPIQTPFLGAVAAYYAVVQERADIYSRKQAATVGLISALFVGIAQLIGAILVSVLMITLIPTSFTYSGYEDFYLTVIDGVPTIIIRNVLIFIFTVIAGYFAGYLSVPAK